MTTEIRHSGLVAEDERVHTDYPRNDPTPWKENWGFLGVDKENDVVVIFHVSLEREKNRARFSRFHNIRGNKYREQVYLEIDENFSTLEHGRIKIDFVEPLEKIRITDKGDDYELDVMFSARFDAYDYASHRKNRKPTGTNKDMNIRHYEQPLLLEGRYSKDGEVLDFGGYGYRDHSWGYRSDAEMDSHNWIWAHFPDCLIHISQMRLNDRSLTAGYIATKEGAIRAKEFETLELHTDENGVPYASRYRIKDVNGKTYTLAAKSLSPVHMPWPDPEGSMSKSGKQYMLMENISTFVLEETGEEGVGADEHGISGEPGHIPAN